MFRRELATIQEMRRLEKEAGLYPSDDEAGPSEPTTSAPSEPAEQPVSLDLHWADSDWLENLPPMSGEVLANWQFDPSLSGAA